MKKIEWFTHWTDRKGYCIPFGQYYLAEGSVVIIGSQARKKEIPVDVGTTCEVSTSRPNVTNGTYQLTQIAYNTEKTQHWQPRYLFKLILIKPKTQIDSNNNGGITNENN